MRREIEIYIRFPLPEGISLFSSWRHYEEKEYVAALQHEIEITLARECSRGAIPGRIIFGGSSRWTSSQSAVRKVFETLYSLFEKYHVRTRSRIPVLIKLDPADVSEATCKLLSRYGVTGAILRVLSFHDTTLQFQKAAHTGQQSLQAYTILKNSTKLFTAVELWSAETVSREAFRKDLECVLGLDIAAVRLKWHDRESILRGLMQSALECAGYQVAGDYYVNPASRHSMLLKRSMQMLGLGAGAKSYVANVKGAVKVSKQNPDAASSYQRRVERMYKKLQKEPYREKIRRYESFIYTSFMSTGELNLDALEKKFALPLEKVHPGLIQILEHLGFVQLCGRSLRLTVEGRKLAANVISNFEIRDEDHQFFITE